jgi:hypothetical protein
MTFSSGDHVLAEAESTERAPRREWWRKLCATTRTRGIESAGTTGLRASIRRQTARSSPTSPGVARRSAVEPRRSRPGLQPRRRAVRSLCATSAPAIPDREALWPVREEV